MARHLVQNILENQNQPFSVVFRGGFKQEGGSRSSPSVQRCSVSLPGSLSKHSVLFRSSEDPPKFSPSTFGDIRHCEMEKKYIYIFLHINLLWSASEVKNSIAAISALIPRAACSHYVPKMCFSHCCHALSFFFFKSSPHFSSPASFY